MTARPAVAKVPAAAMPERPSTKDVLLELERQVSNLLQPGNRSRLLLVDEALRRVRVWEKIKTAIKGRQHFGIPYEDLCAILDGDGET